MKILKRISEKINSTDELEINRRFVIVLVNANAMAISLISGNFIVGLLLLLNADDSLMGLLTVAVYLGNLAQVMAPLLLERYEKRKKILVALRAAYYVLQIVIIGVIPFFPASDSVKVWTILFVIFASNLFNAVVVPGCSIWHIKSIPEGVRAGFFSILNMTYTVVFFLATLGAGKFVDYFKSNGNELAGLEFLRIAAVVFFIMDIFSLLKIKEYENKKAEALPTLKSVFIVPFKEKKYLIGVLIACLWNFTANLPGSYYSVYLLRDLKVSYSYINLINAVSLPFYILVTPVWARRIKNASWFKTLYFSMALFLTSYIGLAFVTRETLALYVVSIIISQLTVPGISLALSNIPYINIPEENQTNFFGFFSTMNTLAALIGAYLGKEFIELTEQSVINILGFVMVNKQYLMLLSAFLMLLSVILIRFLQKKVGNDFIKCSS